MSCILKRTSQLTLFIWESKCISYDEKSSEIIIINDIIILIGLTYMNSVSCPSREVPLIGKSDLSSTGTTSCSWFYFVQICLAVCRAYVYDAWFIMICRGRSIPNSLSVRIWSIITILISIRFYIWICSGVSTQFH